MFVMSEMLWETKNSERRDKGAAQKCTAYARPGEGSTLGVELHPFTVGA